MVSVKTWKKGKSDQRAIAAVKLITGILTTFLPRSVIDKYTIAQVDGIDLF